MTCILTILNEPTDWENAKNFLAEGDKFIHRIKKIKPENLDPLAYERFKEFIASSPNFGPQSLDGISLTCKLLCEWVFALNNYLQRWIVASF